MRRVSSVHVLLSCAGLAVGGQAPGATFAWNNINGGQFTNPANWNAGDGSQTPGPNDLAAFNIIATYTVQFPTILNVAACDLNRGVVTWDLNGNLIAFGDILVPGLNNTNPDFRVRNGVLELGEMRIGVPTLSSGLVTISDGGSLAVATTLVVGANRPGTLTVNTGGFVGTGELTAGESAGSMGSVVVNGPDASIDAGVNLDIGSQDDGSLTITGGGTVFCSALQVSSDSAADSAVTITGDGSVLTCTGQAFVGSGGPATAQILDGGAAVSGQLHLGNQGAGDGRLTVGGEGSSWTANGSINVGRNAMGSVLVETGGTVLGNVNMSVGVEATGSGAVEIAGGTVDLAEQMQVGRSGMGTLLIRSGGTLISTSLNSTSQTAGFVGGLSSAVGVATVQGSGSLWQNQGGSLAVGFSANGTLNIMSGGRVESVGGFVSRSTTATGAVLIDGNTSRWVSTGTVRIGLGPSNVPAGQGRVTVRNGGKLNATETRLGAQGTVAGDGAVAGPVISGGLVSPGVSPGATGVLTFENSYTQQAAGDLFIELDGGNAGSGYDRLAVQGSATLGGDLIIDFPGSFTPNDLQEFTILTASSVTGAFADVIVEDAPAGVSFTVQYNAGNVRLIASVGGSSCPEDVNGDGEVSFGDLNVVVSQFNTVGQGLQGDVDGDGDVDFADLNAVVSVFNTPCPE